MINQTRFKESDFAGLDQQLQLVMGGAGVATRLLRL
jgi:hypothetical protein